MSREHLYKAKRTNWRELPKEEWWVEGHLTQRKDSHGKVFESWIALDAYEQLGVLNMKSALVSEIDFNCYKVDPETVCEYTGLTDRNGRKIFEGDIVSYMDTYSTDNGYAESDCIGKVFWCDEELCFHVTERLYAESWEVLEDCYVIGNIFDNPELLQNNKEFDD